MNYLVMIARHSGSTVKNDVRLDSYGQINARVFLSGSKFVGSEINGEKQSGHQNCERALKSPVTNTAKRFSVLIFKLSKLVRKA